MNTFTHEIHRNRTFISACIYALVTAAASVAGFMLLAGSRGRLSLVFRLLPASSTNGAVLFLSVIFPLLLTYLAIRLNRLVLIWMLAFFKSCIFSFFCFGVRASFSEAGWLIQLLVLFSDHFSMIVYHCIWLQCLVFKSCSVRLCLIAGMFLLLLIYLIDLFLICPFTALLFIH